MLTARPPARPATVAPPAPPPVARRWSGRGRGAATVTLSALTAAAAAGLLRVFSGAAWVGPVFATLFLVHLLCWGARRLRLPSLATALVVVAATALMATWTIFAYSTFYGFVTARTWDQATAALRLLGNEFATMSAPVSPTRGFELIAVGGAALAAALADWCAFRWRAPLVAVLPGLAIFIFCCTSGDTHARAGLIGLQVAATCLFLLTERATANEGQVWFAGVRAGVGAWTGAAGGIIAAAAIVAAIALAPALPRHDGAGLLGWNNGLGQNGGERIVPNPLVDLQTDLIQDANVQVFSVTSSAPSYWRLTSLDDFTGDTWIATGSYGGFGKKLPGTTPAGAAVRTVQAQFSIQALDSPWLPSQFDPISVDGVRRVTYDPGSNSLLTSSPTANGLHYSVTSYEYLDTLSAAELAAAPPVSTGGSLSEYVQLPANIGAPILELADSITAGQTTEYGKALALQNYLRSAPFRYTLDPPVDGSGDNALYNFLFVTRAGYCQQFAGSYAVLARAAGLPTRLAVGFVTGTPANGGYEVYDRDAHTWPEVYFGPQYGWVPFEPTPGFSIPGTQSYAKTSGSNVSEPQSTTPTTVAGSSSATTTPSDRKPTTKSTATTPTTPALAPTPHHSGGLSPWLLLVPGAAALWLLLNGAGPAVRVRLRRRRAAGGGGSAVVLNAWDEVTAELLWHGLRRQPAETDDEFAARATTGLRRGGRGDAEQPWRHGGLIELGALARRATFAPAPAATAGDSRDRAVAAAAEVVTRLRHAVPWRQRVARWWTPPPGSWQRWMAAVHPDGSGEDLEDRGWAAAGASTGSGLGVMVGVSAGEDESAPPGRAHAGRRPD